MTMTTEQRVLNIDGALNFRDLGGYSSDDGRHVRWGLMYRSAQLDRLTDNGIKQLADLGIKTVVDLRFTEETLRYPTFTEAVPNAEILSWHDEAEGDLSARSELMRNSWRDSLESKDPAKVRETMRVNYPQKLYTHQVIYRKMLLRLLEGNVPLVFHCAAGKDRTGVAAALILSLLGVSNEQIISDYLLTQKLLEGRIETWFAGGATSSDQYSSFQDKLAEQPKELLQPVVDADINYIKTLIEYIETTYQGFSGYAQDKLGFDQQAITKLQDKLLI